MDVSPTGFLDVPTLLESSQARPRPAWIWYVGGLFLLLLMAGSYLEASPAKGQPPAGNCSGRWGCSRWRGSWWVLTWLTVAASSRRTPADRIHRGTGAVAALDGGGPGAGCDAVASGTLAAGAHSGVDIPLQRAGALTGDSAMPSRCREYVLDHALLDEATAHGLRLGRAMGHAARGPAVSMRIALSAICGVGAAARNPAGWRWWRSNRDVKTGHPQEAIEIFEQKLSLMREQLGHRVARCPCAGRQGVRSAGAQHRSAGGVRERDDACPDRGTSAAVSGGR